MRRLLLALSFALAMMGLVIVGSVGGNGLPQVGFQADSVSVAEDAGHIDLTVSLSTSSTLTVTVDYATQEGSALAGQDFLSAAGTVTFTPGITLGAISIFLLDDALPEQVESFSVVLTDTQNAALGLHPTMTVTITGDSDLYTVLLPLVWRPVPAPILYPIGNADGDGNYTVTWSAVPMAEFYMLQEDDNPAFSSPVEQYPGYQTSWSATDKASGTYYYRVRVDSTMGHNSGWSNIQQVTVLPRLANVYVQNDTGGTLCYEIDGTGIGRRCFSSGIAYYGSFPAGTYTWHASAPCGSASNTRTYGAGDFLHRFWCGQANSLAKPEQSRIWDLWRAMPEQ